MKTLRSLFFTLLGISTSFSGVIRAQEMSMTMSSGKSDFSEEQIHFFENNIRPMLVKHCYKCHSKDGDRVRGGLLLDTRSDTIRGGDTGPAVVPGSVQESLLYEAITYRDSDMEMPPKYKLPDDVIADFKTWIEMGAPDPRVPEDGEKPAEKYSSTIDIEKARAEHWAWQVPTKHAIPGVTHADWGKNEIDSFILAGLEDADLKPNADTDASTFLRRLYFDLIGLPPNPQATEAFAKAWEVDADKAIEEEVDRLLASERFGERWGRHWLDVARFAESAGKETNATFPHAWRYRDYVIDSFNGDKPYDRFVQEQIAGDLLQFETDEEQAENIVATGFLAIGTKGLNDQSGRQFRFDLVDEQIDTATKAVLGTTVACARCHDHKFDPIPMSDYYAMAGIFLSSDTFYGTSATVQNRRSSPLIELEADIPDASEPPSLGELIELQARHDSVETRLQGVQQEIAEARRGGDEETAGRLRLQSLGLVNQQGILKTNLNQYRDDGSLKKLVMGMQDRDEPFDSQILIRGEVNNMTDERVPRGFVQVIQTNDEQFIPDSQSGRLQLARWMTSPENPMTSRVFVNRAWHWLFGQGIVTSVDNFGTTGQAPSHPELLDHLAIRFLEMEWSVKSLVKEIVTSRTYRMSSDYDEAKFLADPENKLVWRASKRRLDAESFRDAILAVSGQIDFDRPRGSLVAEQGDGFVGRGIALSAVDDFLESNPFNHRSVYLPIMRDAVPDSLKLFDFADPSLVLGARETTTVPSQALYLMNSDFLQKNAEAMAGYLTSDLGLKGAKLGHSAFYLAYSRPPTPEEGRKTRAYFDRFLETAEDAGMSKDQAGRLALITFCQSLMSSAEFRYVN